MDFIIGDVFSLILNYYNNKNGEDLTTGNFFVEVDDARNAVSNTTSGVIYLCVYKILQGPTQTKLLEIYIYISIYILYQSNSLCTYDGYY
jgi:hypothetical protein